MNLLSLLVAAAGLAIHVTNVASAPIGVVVVTADGHRIVVPVADDETDPKGMTDFVRAWSISPGFVRPSPSDEAKLAKLDNGPLAWMMAPSVPGIQVVPHTEDLAHPHPEKARPRKGCVKYLPKHKGFRMTMARKMRHIMNRFRAALGLPLIKPHGLHAHNDEHNDIHPHPHHHEHHDVMNLRPHHQFGDDAPFVVESELLRPDQSDSFFARFGHAMQTLSPWESRAITFVLGLGLGSLLRMFIVLAIVIVRGRRACRARGGRRFGARRCGRGHGRDAEADAAAIAEPLMLSDPPAYSDEVEEKPKVVEEASAKAVIETVEPDAVGTLQIHWKSTNGTLHVTPASEFRQEHPQQLIDFYESNLKWVPAEEELDSETHQ